MPAAASLASLYAAATAAPAAAAIPLLESCSALVSRAALFSPNEPLDDIASRDLPFLLVDFRLACLLLAAPAADRKRALARCDSLFRAFAARCECYGLAASESARTSESSRSPAARRADTIRRYKHEQALQDQLDRLGAPADDALLRTHSLLAIQLALCQTVQNLESIAAELALLDHIPGPRPVPRDPRQQDRHSEPAYSDRLDPPLPASLLDADGKPTQPFVITSARLDVQKSIFRPSYRLPTMSIDDYLASEAARGNILDATTTPQPVADEDDHAQADADTYKARQWDVFTEENPRGAGNTMNRG